ncbi:Predicted transglutaminase-like cysteine proteinase [Sulfurivirga caldicuralii]|uniref:Predicted transglutaminase-like cysteine proteinase n=1 Tax=Sulfurivirga caldicuralii TaxID=364032 RepID=A0A1N6GF11_9GAMM|nr:transglutaminase-like cysteine peptidase [Sulfurivirga caldicuralii]SIO06159.1 Predicted transglutaminase-like cysteine proteinase [Sulfurivirga caldicuralii]
MLRATFAIAIVVATTFGWARLASGPPVVVSPATIQKVEKRYGKPAADRLRAWQRLVEKGWGKPELEQLKLVNDFFNNRIFTTDRRLWHKEDYWATPVEFLIKNAGDCEDFAIAKYFTLRKLGVPDSKLLLTYVKAIRLNQAHMVLTYYKTPRSVPLVLDNINPRILPATKRPDLVPIYTFNGGGLWLAKQRGKGKLLGQSGRLKKWRELQTRLEGIK